LAFTEPDRVSEQDKRKPLADGFRLLLEPFVPEADERQLFRSLLDKGWQITAYFDTSAADSVSGSG
jgi:hypothetical protein